MSYNRRQILKASSLSLGSLVLSSGVAFAGSQSELENTIRMIVQTHFPEEAKDKARVDQFVEKMIAEKVPALEPAGYLKREVRKADHSDLERYVLIQFTIQQ